MEHVKHFRSRLSVLSNHIMSELHCHSTSVFDAGLGC